MDVFPVTWSAGDTGPGGTCRVTAFGKTPDGESACVHIQFTPFFYVAAPNGFSEARCRPLMAEWAKRFDAILEQCRVVKRRSMWGFQNGEQRAFVQLVFRSLDNFRRARYTLAREHDTYEGAVDPVIRLFHLRGLGPCRWLRVARWREPKFMVADVDVEVECSLGDAGPSPRTDRPPLVFASELGAQALPDGLHLAVQLQLRGGVGHQGWTSCRRSASCGCSTSCSRARARAPRNCLLRTLQWPGKSPCCSWPSGAAQIALARSWWSVRRRTCRSGW